MKYLQPIIAITIHNLEEDISGGKNHFLITLPKSIHSIKQGHGGIGNMSHNVLSHDPTNNPDLFENELGGAYIYEKQTVAQLSGARGEPQKIGTRVLATRRDVGVLIHGDELVVRLRTYIFIIKFKNATRFLKSIRRDENNDPSVDSSFYFTLNDSNSNQLALLDEEEMVRDATYLQKAVYNIIAIQRKRNGGIISNDVLMVKWNSKPETHILSSS